MFLIFIETIILSVVQGITEFLPVSSSAHLIIFSKLGNFQADSLTIDIGVHLGSLIAILIFFRKDLLKFSQNKSLYLPWPRYFFQFFLLFLFLGLDCLDRPIDVLFGFGCFRRTVSSFFAINTFLTIYIVIRNTS